MRFSICDMPAYLCLSLWVGIVTHVIGCVNIILVDSALTKEGQMEKEKPMERVFTVNQAAEVTTLSPWTIWSKLSKGVIKRTKVGGRRTVIKESELRKLFVDEER
jgi:hypothetical protein